LYNIVPCNRRSVYTVLVGNPEEKRPRKEGRIILRWIFSKWDGKWTGLMWFRVGTGGGHLKCGNEPSGSIKCGEFLH
jgi:hypothetical protein